MKRFKKALSLLLCGMLMLTAAFPAAATQDAPSEKEEVIYINMNAAGGVKDVYAVNIFGSGEICDYGDYSEVEMLNTTDAIRQKNGKITFSTDADRVYYKGTLKDRTIPWDISVRYYLDGKEYSAADVAGKSGALEIRFRVSKNASCTGTYFDDYALQASLTLDTETCKNITATGATVANVGAKKQISYTMLPGEGVDAVIRADVTDFAMDGVSINGIPLSMNIEVDDEELTDRVKELLDAIAKLDDGAGELQDGTAELQQAASGTLSDGANALAEGAARLFDGAGTLQSGTTAFSDGAKSLQTGANTLDNGMVALHGGIEAIGAGLDALNQKSADLNGGSAQMQAALAEIQRQLSAVSASADEIEELLAGSSQIRAGIDSLSESINQLQQNVSFAAYQQVMLQNGLDIAALQENNAAAIQKLNGQIQTIDQVIQSIEALGIDTTVLKNTLQPLRDICTLLQANNAAIQGMDSYLTELNANISLLAAGVGELQTNYAALDAGIRSLAAQVKGMLMQMNDLKGAIDALVTAYGSMNTGIQEYTGGVAQVLAGYSGLVSGSTALLSGSGALADGTKALYEKTGELLNGMADFYDATGTMAAGSEALASGVSALRDGIDALDAGAGQLKDGCAQMRNETSGMDGEISDRIDEMIDSITGGSAQPVSFVSEKNTNVDAVQFVMQTEKIAVEEPKEAPAPAEEKLTFWQKLLRLFGLY